MRQEVQEDTKMDFLETRMLLEELLTLYTDRPRVSSMVVAQRILQAHAPEMDTAWWGFQREIDPTRQGREVSYHFWRGELHKTWMLTLPLYPGALIPNWREGKGWNQCGILRWDVLAPANWWAWDLQTEFQ